ncbi:MAG: CBS domain-containing protein [Asgard group archaeon]|nr:CBS domain-containing protein [Asgard group archaeon]
MDNSKNIESRLSMELSELMTSTLHTISYNQTADEAAKAMKENQSGSLIVTPKDEEQKPIGIVTERDIVTKVIAQGKDPKKTLVEEIATKPIVTAPPTTDISKAIALMAKLKIRRLVIVEKNNYIGIVTYRDLLRVIPGLLEIAKEYEKIGFGQTEEIEDLELVEEEYDSDSVLNNPDLSLGYYCNQCGEYCDGTPIYDVEDKAICGDCLELD